MHNHYGLLEVFETELLPKWSTAWIFFETTIVHFCTFIAVKNRSINLTDLFTSHKFNKDAIVTVIRKWLIAKLSIAFSHRTSILQWRIAPENKTTTITLLFFYCLHNVGKLLVAFTLFAKSAVVHGDGIWLRQFFSLLKLFLIYQYFTMVFTMSRRACVSESISFIKEN